MTHQQILYLIEDAFIIICVALIMALNVAHRLSRARLSPAQRQQRDTENEYDQRIY